MGGLALTARHLGRQTHGLASLSAAAIIMTLINPRTLWDVGFQLSFFATLGLILYADPLREGAIRFLMRWLSPKQSEKIANPISEFFLFTLAAQITTLPLTAIYFRRLSLVSVLANPVILPLQPLLMITGGLASLLGALWLPLGLADSLGSMVIPCFYKPGGEVLRRMACCKHRPWDFRLSFCHRLLHPAPGWNMGSRSAA